MKWKDMKNEKIGGDVKADDLSLKFFPKGGLYWQNTTHSEFFWLILLCFHCRCSLQLSLSVTLACASSKTCFLMDLDRLFWAKTRARYIQGGLFIVRSSKIDGHGNNNLVYNLFGPILNKVVWYVFGGRGANIYSQYLMHHLLYN